MTAIDPSTAGFATASTITTLDSLTILSPEPAMPEAEIHNVSKLYLASQGYDHQQQAKDRVATAPCTPDKPFSTGQGPHPLSPVTPIPVVVTTGIRSRRPSLIGTTDKKSSSDDRTGPEDHTVLATAGNDAVERPLTDCPAFDPEPLADFIAEHRSTTVKKFHGKS